jgi:copper resistance protein C
MPRSLLAVAIALIALIALISTGGPASAHDELISTDPADGSTVATMPAQLTLTFNLPTLNIGTAVQVTGPGGDVATGKAAAVDDTVTQPLRADAPAGAYEVVWRVTSADGHPISGRFAFTTRRAGAGSPGASPGTNPAASPAASGIAAAGAAGDDPGSPSPLIWVGLAVVVVAVPAGVLLLTRRRPAE